MPRAHSPVPFRVAPSLPSHARVQTSPRAVSSAGHHALSVLDELLEVAPAYVALCRGASHVVEHASAALVALSPSGAAPRGAGDTLAGLCASVTGAERDALLALCDRVYATGEPARAVELSLPPAQQPERGAARELWLDVTVAPRRDDAGSVVGVIVHGTDVTAHVAARRAAEVRGMRLIDEAREAVRTRDEFFAIATHELKTPISVLQLKCEMLDRDAARHETLARDDVRRQLAPVHRQLARLGALLDNLLDLARIRNRHLQLDIEAVDLCALVEQACGRLREAARQVGCELEVERCPDPVVGYCDRLRLEQVLTNLLTNAFKYGAGRPVRVAVHAAADGASARLTVRDRGIGIAPADQARIFERFERSTDAHRQKSLGVGLYIVRAIVEAHGGTVTVDSRPDDGATFAVELPLRRMPDDATT